jgi:magnesium chelatase family protein
MLARLQSYVLQGIDALPCEVEVDLDESVSGGSGPGGDAARPKLLMVGMPDAAVRESLERVSSALINSGYNGPRGKLVVNLAPADMRKEGPIYDLPIAVGVLMAQGVIRASGSEIAVKRATFAPAKMAVAQGEQPRGAWSLEPPKPAGPVVAPRKGDAARPPIAEPLDVRTVLFGGELALDGRVRSIKGAIALAALAKQKGYRGVVVPAENAVEAAVVQGVEVYGVRTLTEVVGILTGHIEPSPTPNTDVSGVLKNVEPPIDFVEVRGQEGVKRALAIAAAGMHNLIELGPSDGLGGRLTFARTRLCVSPTGGKPRQRADQTSGPPSHDGFRLVLLASVSRVASHRSQPVRGCFRIRSRRISPPPLPSRAA